MSIPRVIVVVLNWNRVADTLRCLQSLALSDYPNFETVVVDNASTDGSVAILRSTYPALAVLEAGENLGYTGGNNLGMRYALEQGCDYTWLVNDDVVVAPRSLSALVDAALDEPKAGFLGPKVCSLEDSERILSAGMLLRPDWTVDHRGMGALDQGQYDSVTEMDCLSGCALMISRHLIEAVGMLDDDYFAYGEDVEWCYRGRQAGFRVLFVPKATVWHPDTRSPDRASPVVRYYINRNRLLSMRKHRSGTGTILGTLVRGLFRAANWTIRPTARHSRGQRDALLRAFLDFGLGRTGKARWYN